MKVEAMNMKKIKKECMGRTGGKRGNGEIYVVI